MTLKTHIALACIVCNLSLTAALAQRKICLDAAWKFHYGPAEEAVSPGYDDSAWRTLDLPHDWSVETEAAQAAGGTVVGPFSTNSIGKYQTGNTVGGEGWYRKTFKIEDGKLKIEDGVTRGEFPVTNHLFSIYFEGAYNQADVWLNGRHVYFNHYGYQPFRFDITGELLTDACENVLTVRVRNEGQNTRWYAGSGLYRHVWLISTPQVHQREWETVVNCEKGKLKIENGLASGEVSIETKIYNDGAKAAKCSVGVDVIDAQGKSVAKAKTTATVKAGSCQPVTLSLAVADAHTWSPDAPYLYKAILTITDRARHTTDTIVKPLGLRTIEVSATEGFRLNGQPMLLRGGCIHHDNGLLGAAAYDAAEDRKLRLLKEQGFNAVRCSHNMPSDHFLDACDAIGLMVIDECFDQWLRKKNDNDYHQYFREHSDRDLQTMVCRDRCHPSVVMWSIGNEIPGRIEPDGLAAAERMRQTILSLDTTRPITAAVCGWDEGDAWNAAAHDWGRQDNNAFRSLDVGGYNYLYGKYVHDHKTHPDRVMCGLESYPKEASRNWDLVEQKPYVIGDFVWTAMDYLGEAGIGSASIRTEGRQSMFQKWPWYNGWCGDIDLIGQKKPQSYYRDVVWHRAPVTMGVEKPIPQGAHQSVSAWGWQLEEQCWTYPEMENDTAANMTVNVYSRAPRVRLYLNGDVVGENTPGSTYWAGFTVRYRPGTLKAVNLDALGREVEGETFTLQTTGNPAALRLTTNRTTIAANGQDLCYVTIELVDDKGRVVYDSERSVRLEASGDGVLLAAGNASPTDMASFRSSTPRLYNGRALAILKGNTTNGTVTLNATSEGLEAQSVEVKIEED